jgi:hypothetical protein
VVKPAGRPSMVFIGRYCGPRLAAVLRRACGSAGSAHGGGTRAAGRSGGPSRGCRSAVECRPADVVPQPLVVQYELANPWRELVTLPVALEPTRGLTCAIRRGRTCGLDRIGGRAELVRGDVCDGPGLPCSVRRMTCSTTQIPGRAHRLTARRTSLHHRDLATHPGACVLDRPTRSGVVRSDRFKEGKDVLRARGRPQGEKVVIRLGESATAADRHETRVPHFWQDHG